MSILFGTPGCDCGCVSCDICEDTFNRANDTDINTGSDCGLTETAGSWSISSNTLVTSSANAKVTIEALHPDGGGSFYIRAIGVVSNSGDEIKVWTDVSANNYAKVIYDGGSQVRFKLYVAGAEVSTATYPSKGAGPWTIDVVQSVNTLSASLADDAGDSLLAPCPNPAGTVKTAIGTGTLTGTATFSQIVLKKSYDAANEDCHKPYAECDACEDDIPPNYVTLTFGPDVTNNDCPTFDCATLANTTIELYTTDGCNFVSDPITFCGSPFRFTISLSNADGGSVVLSSVTTAIDTRRVIGLGNPFDCMESQEFPEDAPIGFIPCSYGTVIYEAF